MSKLQMIYIEIFLILFGYFYMFNAYQIVTLILAGWAFLLAIFNLHLDNKIFIRIGIFFGIQVIMIIASSIYINFEEVFVLSLGSTIVWESFMSIYNQGNDLLRKRMDNIIYAIIFIYLTFMIILIIIPLTVKTSFVLIQLLFVPAIGRFFLEKI